MVVPNREVIRDMAPDRGWRKKGLKSPEPGINEYSIESCIKRKKNFIAHFF